MSEHKAPVCFISSARPLGFLRSDSGRLIIVSGIFRGVSQSLAWTAIRSPISEEEGIISLHQGLLSLRLHISASLVRISSPGFPNYALDFLLFSKLNSSYRRRRQCWCESPPQSWMRSKRGSGLGRPGAWHTYAHVVSGRSR